DADLRRPSRHRRVTVVAPRRLTALRADAKFPAHCWKSSMWPDSDMPRVAARPAPLDVSRRERQIMDVLFARERATAAEIQANLPDAPSYSAVRALLRILDNNVHVRY